MKTKLNGLGATTTATFCVAIWLLVPSATRAHHDATDGPVATAAKTALEKSDVTLALKWVRKERETGIRKAFHQTLVVRKLGPEAKELADKYFVETLVRIHRVGEGAADAGPRPSGVEIEAAVTKADEALISGSVKPLAQSLADAVADGIRQRFACAHAAKENADGSAEAGREYVEAYVEFIHYIERIAQATKPSVAEPKH